MDGYLEETILRVPANNTVILGADSVTKTSVFGKWLIKWK